MIKAKEAVQIARDQILEWFNEDELQALELKEVELSEDERLWLITLSYSVKRTNSVASEIMSGTAPDSVRTSKMFAIDVESGEVRSMKQRKR